MNKLFVYGSLMNQEVLQTLYVSGVTLMPAVLQNFQRVNVINETYPGMLPKQDESVEGMLTSELSEVQLEILDEFEGDYYQRTEVSVDCADGTVACGTYVFKPEYYHLLGDKPWSNDVFRAEYMNKFLAMYC